MPDFSVIKSPKLKGLIEQSIKFSTLPESEQNSTLAQIAGLSLEEQENIYCGFFESENAKEKTAKDNAMIQTMAKIEEEDKQIQNLARQDKENISKGKESEQETYLLNQLSNI